MLSMSGASVFAWVTMCINCIPHFGKYNSNCWLSLLQAASRVHISNNTLLIIVLSSVMGEAQRQHDRPSKQLTAPQSSKDWGIRMAMATL